MFYTNNDYDAYVNAHLTDKSNMVSLVWAGSGRPWIDISGLDFQRRSGSREVLNFV